MKFACRALVDDQVVCETEPCAPSAPLPSVPPRRTRPPLPSQASEWGDAPEGWVAGVDEVDVVLAGPVVAAAVWLPAGETPPAGTRRPERDPARGPGPRD